MANKVIYSVTVNIDADVHDEWLQYMTEIHIPDVMATGCFLGSRMLKMQESPDVEGFTYNFQYLVKDLDTYENYKVVYAPGLQAAVNNKFEGKFLAFRTLLDMVAEF